MTNVICGIDFKRRSATRNVCPDGYRGLLSFRGLKPAATIMGSLCDSADDGDRMACSSILENNHVFQHTVSNIRSCLCRGATLEGSRAFQRTVKRVIVDVRRVAAVEMANLNSKANEPEDLLRPHLGEFSI